MQILTALGCYYHSITGPPITKETLILSHMLLIALDATQSQGAKLKDFQMFVSPPFEQCQCL